ncbi:MAG: histidine kinase N-terminal domain-containing protein [Coriobacteriia bacterium]|nr:histidine kinase N-terminal domain-containing protein [Coriobacteriia bacterium]
MSTRPPLTLDLPADTPAGTREHLANVARNLQLLADLGYGTVSLALAEDEAGARGGGEGGVEAGGALRVLAEARPMTAVPAVATSRVGRRLTADDEPEAFEALAAAGPVIGVRRRTTRGMRYATEAYPVGDPPYAVVLRDLTEQVVEAPGKMERVFMDAAEVLLGVLRDGPLRDLANGEPFITHRVAGDGVLTLDERGQVRYASPNAVNIMRLAGVDGPVTGLSAEGLPGGAQAVAPVLGSGGALATEVATAARVLSYRTLALPRGALVLVEDVTEAKRREAEIKVKEATIREVHHRVKNNLQTIASLLRIQARRSGSDEASRALREAVERVSSMAVVHEMLAGSTEERVDFADAARTVVDMVGRGLSGTAEDVRVAVEGSSGKVPAAVATSLALVTAELVHNAIEHGLAGTSGEVTVSMRRLPAELHLVVRDTGRGLPEGFDIASASNLGLAIVRTVVEDDLRGTLSFGRGRGTTVTIRVPVDEGEREGA